MTNTNATPLEPIAAYAAATPPPAAPTTTPARAPEAKAATRGSRAALASLSLAMLLASLGNSIANVALPTLVGAFGATFQEVQWVVLAYLLASTMVVVAAGRLGDVIGRRRLLVVGLLGFALASVGAGLAPNLAVLVFARAVQGCAAAVMMALPMALVVEAVAKDRAGRAMGMLGTMSAVGTALGPSLGGAMIAAFGWRSIFLVPVPLALLGGLLVRRHVRAESRVPGAAVARFDHLGTWVLATTLGAYALAMTLGRGSFGPANLALLLAAAVGVGGFVFVERRAAAPLVPLAAGRDPLLRAGLATSLLVSTVMMATLVVGPFHLMGALGLDAVQVGLAMSVGPATAALSGVPAGRLVDRFGAHRVMLAGLGGLGVGCSAIAVLPFTAGVPGYLLPIVLTTAGYALFQAANNTLVMAEVTPGQRGLVSGLLHLSRNLGFVTGAAVLGVVFAAAAGTHEPAGQAPEAVAVGTRTTFAVAGLLIAVAAVIALRTLARRAAGSSPTAGGSVLDQRAPQPPALLPRPAAPT